MEKKHFGNISKKGKVGLFSALFVMVLTAIMAFDFAGVRSLIAEKIGFMDAGQVPAHQKTLSDNNDGTYQLELSVVGDSELEKAANVNVLIVYDESSSMTSNNVTTNPNRNRADYAEDVVHDFIAGLQRYQKGDGSNIQVALVGFGPNATTRQGWTSNLGETGQGINRFFDDGVDGSVTSSHNYSSNNGTNWQAALNQAQTVLNSADEDPTFVILVTDGAPTAASGETTIAPSSSRPWTDYRVYYRAATQTARAIQTRDDTTLYGIYAYGTEADLLDELIYYSNTGNHRVVDGYSVNNATAQQHNFGTSEVTDNYFNAGNTAALNEAVASIFDKVIEALGISSVSISDGTTSNVTTTSGEISHLLTVDENSYKYWLEVPTTNNKFKRVDISTGEEIEYTVVDEDPDDDLLTITWPGNSITVTGKAVVGGFKYQWENNADQKKLYNKDVPEAHLVNGAVEWNLNSIGALLDGVKYSITFDVYPSQETYDMIADLKNAGNTTEERRTAYEALDSNIKQYLDHDDEYFNYYLKTNTEATLSYADTRVDETIHEVTFNPPVPDHVKTDAEKMKITKTWENYTGDGKDETATVNVLQDNKNYFDDPIELTPADNTEEFFIATGLMKVDKATGSINILDTGHEYSFSESGPADYNWELVSETVRPMIINGELFKLIKLDENVTNIFTEDGEPLYTVPDMEGDYLSQDGKEYYKIDGEIYVAVKDSGVATLNAVNYRRSNLNIKKTVDGISAPITDEFTYTINIKDEGATDDLWFSICDTKVDATCKSNDSFVTDQTISGTTKSGNYYVLPKASLLAGSELSVILHNGENLRFTNLTTQTTYDVEETEMPSSYKFGSVSVNKSFGEDGDSETDESATIEGKKVTGSIGLTNSTYEVLFTNIYEKVDVTVEKIWDDVNDGVRPDSIDVMLSATLKDGTAYELDDDVATGTLSKDTEEVLEDGKIKWTYTWEKLDRFANEQDIIYSVEEITDEYILEHYKTSDPVGDMNSGFTITNTRYPYDINIDIPVEKAWEEDDGGSEGLRTSVEVELLIKNADGSTTPTGKTLTLTSQKNWKDEFKDLAKYDNGVEILYSVRENTTNDHYTTEVSGDNNKLIVTNTRKDDKTIDIPVEKAWEEDDGGSEGLRTSVEVELLIKNSDGSTTTTNKKLTLTEAKEWKNTFIGVAKYANGKEIQYTVQENTTNAHYTTAVSGNNAKIIVTNTRKDDKTVDIPVEKVWDKDDDGAEGLRTSVEVELLIKNDDQSTTTTGKKLTLTKEKGWIDSFLGVAKYANGKEIQYTVQENTTNAHYTTAVSGNNAKIIVTNTRKDDKLINISVEKQWLGDNNGSEGLRTSVEVELFIKNLDGSTTSTGKKLTLTSEKSWKDEFKDLAKYANGQEINYQIKEVKVDHYSTSITGDKTNGFIVKNTREDDKTIDIPVEKVWDNDDDGAEGLRTSVEVELLVKNADGSTTTTNKKLTLTEAKEWKDIFVGVAKYADGKEIQYSIRENTTNEHYTVSVSGNNTKLFVTNTRKDDKTIDIPVEKVWDKDDDGAEGLRTSVEVELLIKNDDQSTTTTGKKLTLTKEKGWIDSFTGVAKYANGELIHYSVKENTTNAHYTTEVSGNNTKLFVTNTRKDDKLINIPVEKQWLGDNNGSEGLRTSVEVELLIGKENTGKKLTLTSEKSWKDEFKDLAKYANGQEINYQIKEVKVDHYSTSITGDKTNGFIVKNTREDDKTIDIPVEKVWDNDDDGAEGLRTSVEVELLVKNADGSTTTTNKKLTLTEAKEWKDIFVGVAKYADGKEIQYGIRENTTNEHYTVSVSGNNTKLIVKNTRGDDKYVSTTVKKNWEDKEDQDGVRPDTLNVVLSNGKTETVYQLKKADGWTLTVNNLPKYIDGKEATYAWSEPEANVPEGYTYDGKTTEGTTTTITNKHTTDVTAVNVQKVWDDNENQDGLRTAIEVELFKTIKDAVSGEEITSTTEQTATLSEDNNWFASFTGLDKNANGELILYSVVENTKLEGYNTPVISDPVNEGTITVTNKRDNFLTTSRTVKKVWHDDDNQDGKRPDELVVKLMDGETEVGSVTLKASNNWTATIDGLPLNRGGSAINYTWAEFEMPEGYTLEDKTTEGLVTTITNKHESEIIPIKVKKIWDNSKNTYGFTNPTSIKATLKDGETVLKDVTLSADNNWEATFGDYPRYRDGSEIIYSVTEEALGDYETVIEGSGAEGFTIKNTYVVQPIDVIVEKSWKDNSDSDGKRPDNIKVTLTGKVGEEPVYTDNATIEGTEEDTWTYTFKDLPKTYFGKEITYTVTEEAVEGYEEPEYTGDITTKLVITNPYKTATVSYHVKKVWQEDDGYTGGRPESITVKLTANDGSEPRTAELSDSNNWYCEFNDLPKFMNHGEAITYTIEEVEVPETYESEPSIETDGDVSTVTITNTRATEIFWERIQKIWDDQDNKYGYRPKSIDVEVYANGELFDTFTLTAEDDWKLVITLPRYIDGVEAKYSIKEINVPEYITSIDGFTITNKLNHTEIVPPNTSVSTTDDGLMSIMVILGTFGILGYSVRKRYE